MKQFVSLFAAGALGALITLGGYQLIDKSQESSNLSPDAVFSASLSTNSPTRIAAPAIDFSEAAEISMPAVVQIKASESDQLARQRREEQRRQDPWSQFFDFV